MKNRILVAFFVLQLTISGAPLLAYAQNDSVSLSETAALLQSIQNILNSLTQQIEWFSGSSSIAQAQSANLLANPGFESDFASWNSTAGTIDATTFRSGSKSAKLTTTSATNVASQMYQEIPVIPGETYDVEGYGKTFNLIITRSSGIIFEFWDSTGSRISRNTVGNLIDGDNDWTLLQNSFIAPSNAATARVMLWVQKVDGTIWWDDIFVSSSGGSSPDTEAPTVPSSLSATTVSSSQINVSWSASTDNIAVTNYRLERCLGSTCTNFAQIATPSGTSYSNTGLSANTTYRYRVQATDAAGNLSGYSSIASATTQQISSTKFSINDRVEVFGTGGSGINVRSCAGTSCSILGTQAESNQGTVIGGPTAADGFWWWQIDYDSAPDGWSVEDFLKKVTMPPPSGSNLLSNPGFENDFLNWNSTVGTIDTTTFRSGSKSAKLTTTSATNVASQMYQEISVSSGAVYDVGGYGKISSGASITGSINIYFEFWDAIGNRIERNAVDSLFSTDTNWKLIQGQFTAPSGAAFGRIMLWVQKVDGTIWWDDLFINGDSTPLSSDTEAPTAPTNLTATTVSSSQISLSWTASLDNVGVAGYHIERCAGGTCTNFSRITTITETSYANTGLSADTMYRYRVQATDAAGNLSSYSTIASATTDISGGTTSGAQYPPSSVVDGISFDLSTIRTEAPGSDNWALTWADDGHQYTTWGDGGGFGGTNDTGRVSLGFGRVEGGKSNYIGKNVWGGKSPENPAQFPGKSYGLISIGATMYMWRCGSASDANVFGLQELYQSTNHSATWEYTGVGYTQDFFPNSKGFFCPTFLQFGQGYQGAMDSYVYSYAPENKDDVWEVQYPGEITLMRVLKTQMSSPSAYEYFAGKDANGNPLWTANIAQRKPVFEDAVNGVMRTAVNYNAGLGRYFLVTQQVQRQGRNGYHVGIYDAPNPWGPWTTVLFANPYLDLGINDGGKTVYWNFSNKWASADGKDFVMVYTGPGADEWGTIAGNFSVVTSGTDTTPPFRSNGSPSGSLPAGTTFAALSLATNENATCKYATMGGVSYVSMPNTFSTMGGTSHATTVSGLTDGAAYSYYIKCIDHAGNVNTTDFLISFDVGLEDITPPTVSITSPVNGATVSGTVTVSVDATDASGISEVSFFVDSSPLGLDDAAPYSVFWDTTSVTNGSHIIEAVALDGVGNSNSASIIVTVDNQITSTKFSINDRVQVQTGDGSSLNVRSCASISCSIAGAQAEGNQGTVIGGPTVANGFNWWQIDYDSGADGWSVEDFLIAAGSQLDTEAPTAPGTPSLTILSSSSISLSWSVASDNVKVTNYRVYRNGVAIYTGGTSRSYTDTGLVPSMTYSYRVSALDATGNESALSNAAAATTFAESITVSFDRLLEIFGVPIKIRSQHPRIFINSDNLADYKNRMAVHPHWNTTLSNAGKTDKKNAHYAALAYLITNNATYLANAKAGMDNTITIDATTGKQIIADNDLDVFAMAFDWAYNGLTLAERSKYITVMSNTLENAFATDLFTQKKTVYTFHGQVTMDVSTGWKYSYALLALAGHHAEAEPAIQKLMVNVRENFAFQDYLNDGSYPTGSYSYQYISGSSLPAFLAAFQAIEGMPMTPQVFPWIANLGYYWIYMTQFDAIGPRTLQRKGEHKGISPYFNVSLSGTSHVTPVNFRLSTMISQSIANNPHYQWYLNNVTPSAMSGKDHIWDIIFYNPLLSETAFKGALPLSRFFGGINMMMMRSGWGQNDIWASIKATDAFRMHTANDALSFAIYKNGFLNPHSGYYIYGTPYQHTYPQNTIAWNSLILENPNIDALPEPERSKQINGNVYTGDQRQQPKPRPFITGPKVEENAIEGSFIGDYETYNMITTLGYDQTSTYDYIAYDGTKAYELDEMKEAARQFLFLRNKGIFVVFDRVESFDPTFIKKWLLHFNPEPKFTGSPTNVEVIGHLETYSKPNKIEATNPGGGNVTVFPLLPTNNNIRKIGGNRKDASATAFKNVNETVTMIKQGSPVYNPYTIWYWNDEHNPPQMEPAIGLGVDRNADGLAWNIQITNASLNITIGDRSTTIDFATYPTIGSVFDRLREVSNDNKVFKDYFAVVLFASYEEYTDGPRHEDFLATPLGQLPTNNIGPEFRGAYEEYEYAEGDSGHWRIESSPATKQARDYFLNVISVKNSGASAPTVSVNETSTIVTLTITDGGSTETVTFSKTGSVSGTLNGTLLGKTVPTPPASPSISVSSGAQGRPLLSWNNVANEAGYAIFRSTSQTSGFVLTGYAEKDRTSWLDDSLSWSSGTQYYYKVIAYNNAGLSPGLPTSSQPPPADTSPPVVVADPPGGEYEGTVGVDLTSDEPATIYYTIDGTNPTTSSPVYSSTISITVNTTLKFFGRDAVGNTSSISTELYSIIPAAADTQAPTAPSNLSATAVSSSQINLSWTASIDNVGVTGYRVERCEGSSCSNFTQTGTLSGTSYVDSSLTGNTMYRYRVQAQDAAGNLSGYSNIASATTPETSSDTISPTVSITAPAEGTTVVDTESVTASASDDIGVAKVEFYVDGALKATDILSPYSFSWDTTNGGTHACIGPHTHILSAKAYDAVNNMGTSPDVLVYMNDPAYCTISTDKFAIGDRVEVQTGDTSKLNIRSTPSLSSTLVGQHTNGTLGTVIGGPIIADGYIWWEIDYDNTTVDGWSVEDFLVEATETPPSGTNILSNPGFESDFVNWNSTAGTIDTTTSHSGSKSAKLTTTSATNVASQMYQDVFSIIPNATYEVSGFGKVQNAVITGEISILLEFWDTNVFPALRISRNTIASLSATDTNWTSLQQEFVSPANATVARVMLLVQRVDGTIWWDDIYFGEKSSSISPSQELVGYWKFDEGFGTITNDSSGKGNHGTLVNSPTWVSSGKVGGALDFDGANDYIIVPKSTSVNNLPAITVAAWINPRSAGDTQKGLIISKRPGPAFRLRATSTNPTFMRFESDFDGVDIFRTSKDGYITHNQWQHVAITWDGSINGSNVRFYVNGVETGYKETDNATGLRLDDSTIDLILGGFGDGSSTFDGMIDELRIYNYALTQSEIQNLPSVSGSIPLQGDLNLDGTVNNLDWAIMSAVWFTADATADLNSDGIVNSIDFSLMNGNWGKTQ
jgi:chitodextrinase